MPTQNSPRNMHDDECILVKIGIHERWRKFRMSGVISHIVCKANAFWQESDEGDFPLSPVVKFVRYW